jgi:hypothetical protein
MARADRHQAQNRDNRAQRYRSPAVSLGRFTELQNVELMPQSEARQSEVRPECEGDPALLPEWPLM